MFWKSSRRYIYAMICENIEKRVFHIALLWQVCVKYNGQIRMQVNDFIVHLSTVP